MKIPQLIQEIIDYYLYYLYLVPWKAKIKQLNEEYYGQFIYVTVRSSPLSEYLLHQPTYMVYNWRNIIDQTRNLTDAIYNRIVHKRRVAKLPSRHYFSNTKEQLKSLYF